MEKGEVNVVYILVSENPKCRGKIYIGYTVNPARRLKQHNGGKAAGGARKTNSGGPWKMVLFVSGFPNEVAALRFEWGWQQPDRSRRLKTLRRKRVSESPLEFRLFVLQEMLTVGPWCRLPLTVHWLTDEVRPLSLPSHVPTLYSADVPARPDVVVASPGCFFCEDPSKQKVRCPMEHCPLRSHLGCLADHLLGDSHHILPISGDCPLCYTKILWGDVARPGKEEPVDYESS